MQARGSWLMSGGLAIGVVLAATPGAHAVCDVIPGPTAAYRGALGTLNRPFALPGDTGQQLEITLKQGQCDAASAGFLNVGGGIAEDDYYVTVLFEPPAAGAPRNAVVISTAANSASCTAAVAAALPQLGAGGAGFCRTVTPETQELAIPAAETLVFRFPDTDADFAPDNDDRTFTGPATIAVTPISAPLPFGLATARCADIAGLVACIDELYPADGSCDNGTASAPNVDPVFGSFTALPPPNDYQALCSTPSTECTGAASELRFTIDRAGHVLVPMDWRGVLLRPDGIPVPRLLRGETDFPAFASAPANPVRVPSRSYLASYAPSGRRVPPIFEPLADPSSPSDLVLFGSVDADVGVMRVARRLPNDSGVYQECSGGTNDSLPCLGAEDCPSGACGPTTCYQPSGTPTTTPCTRDAQCTGSGQVCGPSLFDFSDRLAASGVGPVLISSAQYALNAQNPVPLEGLLETPAMFAFVELEAIAGSSGGGPTPQDLNGDGDTTDAVVVLRDRTTGVITPIGTASNVGRAATRIHQEPFSSPAVAVEGDVAAFLESEPLQGNEDANGNRAVFDSILRVYRMTNCSGAPCAQALDTDGLAVDADPIVEGQSVVVANGRIYFRASEVQNALETTARITSTPFDSVPPVMSVGSYYPELSGNGRYVDFTTSVSFTSATGCGADMNNVPDVYAFDRDSNGDGVFDDPSPTFTRLSVRTDGCQGDPGPVVNDTRSYGGASRTPDGRFVSFNSTANLDPSVPTDDSGPQPPGNEWIAQVDAYLRDRDVDQDGIFDEPGQVATRTIGLSSTGLEGNRNTGPGPITPDGRFIVLSSLATNLVPNDSNFEEDLFVRDLQTGTTTRVGVGPNCNELSGPGNYSGSQGGPITDDGRFVGFFTTTQAVPEDTDTATDVYLRDRDADEDGIYDECSQPGATNTSLVSFSPPTINQNLEDSTNIKFSGDGSVIAFWSNSTNLVPGDTNGSLDAFVKDTRTGIVSRVSVASDGSQADAASTYAYGEVSADGRYVNFNTSAGNLVPKAAPNTIVDLFVHDRVTGHTARVSQPVGGGDANGDTYYGMFDGPFITFSSKATNLDGTDLNGSQNDVFVRGPDTTDSSADFSGDGRLDDTVLYVLDTTAVTPTPIPLSPANGVSVSSDGAAAFLRPEERNGYPLYTDSFTCNADGDFDDACVYLSENGAGAISLGREATAIAISTELVAALVPGVGGEFLEVYDRGNPGWTGPLGPTADSIQVTGSTVAVHATDGSLWVYELGAGAPVQVAASAEDYVTGDRVVAFRTRETLATGSLNPDADNDTNDDVIQVWDLVTSQLLETAQAVTPCNFEACRPRRPYRVSGDNVTFLTLEADQGGLDLDGNGNANGIVIQTFNVRKAAQALGGGGGGFAPAAFSLFSGGSPEVITLAGVSAGVCTTTGEACSTDADCGGAARSCFLPPGGCIQKLTTTPCNVNPGCDGSGQFCVPTLGDNGNGYCHINHGPCGDNADCSTSPGFPTNTSCQDSDQDRVRLFAPLASESNSGDQLLPALETGEGSCTSDAQCAADEFCSPLLRCQPDEPELVTVGDPDTDGDGVSDSLDVCPRVADPGQADQDGDGTGDPCDLQTCGDGVQTYEEECDDAGAPGGCSGACTLPDIACGNGRDDDGDGKTDYPADKGCASAADTSERTSARACDDGIDNDGDGYIDYAFAAPASSLDDLGCGSHTGALEDPQCQNGLNDDGVVGVDFDGGASLGLSGPADPQCTSPTSNREAPPPPSGPACGLGPELAALLPLLEVLRRRRRAAHR